MPARDLLRLGKQTRVAPDRGGVDRDRLLEGEARQIIRAAGLWTRSRPPRPAERLRAHNCADHVAVDVDVPRGEPRDDVLDGEIDPGMDAERQPVAARRDVIEQPIERIGPPAHHVEHRAEYLLLEVAGAIELDDR